MYSMYCKKKLNVCRRVTSQITVCLSPHPNSFFLFLDLQMSRLITPTSCISTTSHLHIVDYLKPPPAVIKNSREQNPSTKRLRHGRARFRRGKENSRGGLKKSVQSKVYAWIGILSNQFLPPRIIGYNARKEDDRFFFNGPAPARNNQTEGKRIFQEFSTGILSLP